ncbi:MAG: hypothetical protein IKH57_21365 [Clostridia bacterium]|nr:hypothetical protein [Clostridia bacterium]
MAYVYVRVSDLQKLVLDMKHEQLDIARLSIDAFEEGEPPALYVDGVNIVHAGPVIEMEPLDSDESLSRFFSSNVFTNLT